MSFNKSIQRAKLIVHDPVFDKPIQNKDYSKKGTVTLVTKIKPKYHENHN